MHIYTNNSKVRGDHLEMDAFLLLHGIHVVGQVTMAIRGIKILPKLFRDNSKVDRASVGTFS